MRHGLHHAVVQAKGGLEQVLAIAGHRAVRDFRLEMMFLAHLLELLQRLPERVETVAIVIAVITIEQPAHRIQHHEFGGGGAGVHAHKDTIVLHLAPIHTGHEEILFLSLPGGKGRFILEEGCKAVLKQHIIINGEILNIM